MSEKRRNFPQPLSSVTSERKGTVATPQTATRNAFAAPQAAARNVVATPR